MLNDIEAGKRLAMCGSSLTKAGLTDKAARRAFVELEDWADRTDRLRTKLILRNWSEIGVRLGLDDARDMLCRANAEMAELTKNH